MPEYTIAEFVGGPRDGDTMALPWPPPPEWRIAIHTAQHPSLATEYADAVVDTFRTGVYRRSFSWDMGLSDERYPKLDYNWAGEE